MVVWGSSPCVGAGVSPSMDSSRFFGGLVMLGAEKSKTCVPCLLDYCCCFFFLQRIVGVPNFEKDVKSCCKVDTLLISIMIMQSTWMWNLEHGPNGERDVSDGEKRTSIFHVFFKATSVLRVISDKSTKIRFNFNLHQHQQWTATHLAQWQKKQHALPRCVWLNWASYYYGRPDGLTFLQKKTRKTTDSRHLMVSWCLPSWLRFIRKTLYPWRIWSTRQDENLYLKMPKKTWNFQNEK